MDWHLYCASANGYAWIPATTTHTYGRSRKNPQSCHNAAMGESGMCALQAEADFGLLRQSGQDIGDELGAAVEVFKV